MKDEDGSELSNQSGKDILQIVSRSLKETKWLKSQHTVKVMSQLTAVAEYVKLCTCYLSNNNSSKLYTNVSLAIA